MIYKNLNSEKMKLLKLQLKEKIKKKCLEN